MIPLRRLVPLPTPPLGAFPRPILESDMVARKSQPRIPATAAKLAAMPVQHTHAAGIDGGDATHWVCVDATPDGTDTVREFPLTRRAYANSWTGFDNAVSPPSHSKPAASTDTSSSSP